MAIAPVKTLYYLRQWSHQRIQRRLIYPVCRRLYRDRNGDLDRSIVVAGTARSGTTWLARIISSQISCRVMFEPFHSRLVDAYANFNYFQYMRPESFDEELRNYCQVVFSGNIRHPWIDRQVTAIFPHYRLIKEIRANLFLKWIHNHFPQIPLLFVIRHPCAVVLSRLQLGWATDGDIEPLLTQEELVQDFLVDKMDVIRGARSPEEKHAVIWCVSNLVPLSQFAPGELPIVFYEHLCTRPEAEVERIFCTINQAYTSSVFHTMERPSTTATSTSAVMRGHDRVTRWQKELSPHQVRDILSVVEAFGLDNLYGDSPLPLGDEFISSRQSRLEPAHGQ